MKRLHFMNKRLRKKLKRKHISTTLTRQWLSTITYLRKKIKPLPPEPELADFYHPSKNKKNGELLFVVVGTGVVRYALYKYLK